jgi:hydroxymethylpyrimidine/phosphomethylpyrimidine kinase
MSAIVALTAQNTIGVRAIHDVPPAFAREQIDAVLDDIGADAAKTGMLFSAPLIAAVADALAARDLPLVVDPVMVASSGSRLLRPDAIETLVARLFPLATVVTPNLPEAQALTQVATEDRAALAERLVAMGARAALVTGATGPSRWTTCSTGRGTWPSRWPAIMWPPPTARAAPTRRRWRPGWPRGCRWPRRPARPRRWPVTRWRTGSRPSGEARARFTSCTWFPVAGKRRAERTAKVPCMYEMQGTLPGLAAPGRPGALAFRCRVPPAGAGLPREAQVSLLLPRPEVASGGGARP